MWNSRCARGLNDAFFVAPFSRLLVREVGPYLSCSLSITMRNVESRSARGSLRTRVLPVYDNKKKELCWSRESEEEGSRAEWSKEDDEDTEGERRNKEAASKRKERHRARRMKWNEIRRDLKKRGEPEREKRILRTLRCNECERTGRIEKGEEKSDVSKRRRCRWSSAKKREVVKMKMIEKMKR